jgi:hypothetical protein
LGILKLLNLKLFNNNKYLKIIKNYIIKTLNFYFYLLKLYKISVRGHV